MGRHYSKRAIVVHAVKTACSLLPFPPYYTFPSSTVIKPVVFAIKTSIFLSVLARSTRRNMPKTITGASNMIGLRLFCVTSRVNPLLRYISASYGSRHLDLPGTTGTICLIASAPSKLRLHGQTISTLTSRTVFFLDDSTHHSSPITTSTRNFVRARRGLGSSTPISPWKRAGSQAIDRPFNPLTCFIIVWESPLLNLLAQCTDHTNQ